MIQFLPQSEYLHQYRYSKDVQHQEQEPPNMCNTRNENLPILSLIAIRSVTAEQGMLFKCGQLWPCATDTDTNRKQIVRHINYNNITNGMHFWYYLLDTWILLSVFTFLILLSLSKKSLSNVLRRFLFDVSAHFLSWRLLIASIMMIDSAGLLGVIARIQLFR